MKLNRYYVYYTTTDGEHARCWVTACTKQEAIDSAFREFDDIASIDSVQKQ